MNTHYKVPGKALALCNAFGFLFPGELFLIQAIIQSLPADAVVVNIGAGVGTGSLGMVEMKPTIQAFTVDISAGGPFGGMENEINAFRSAELPCPVQILGDSQEVWKSWPEISHDKKIDLLFIDGDHSAAGLQKDIDGWVPFVKTGGYVLYHDYQSVAWGDVTRVVDENMLGMEWQTVLVVDTLIAFRRVEIRSLETAAVITKRPARAGK